MKKKVMSIMLVVCLAMCTVFAVQISSQAATPTGTAVATVAKGLVNKATYKSGGNGPTEFDASGLVIYSYKQAANIDLSKKLGRTCQTLYNGVVKNKLTTTKAKLAKGDIVFYGTSASKITNAAIYIDTNKVVYVSSKVKSAAINSAAAKGTKVIGYASAASIIKKYAKTSTSTETTATQPTTTQPATTQPAATETTAASSANGTALAKTATGLVGKSYKSGGNGPSAFDASGLVIYTYKNTVKIDLSKKLSGRTCQSLYNGVVKNKLTTTKAKLAKGDIVFYGTSASKITNAAIYVGNNKVVSVSSKGVKTATMSSIATGGIKAVGYASADKIIKAYK
jgi:cell wall-associated NlpC family hydrolase